MSFVGFTRTIKCFRRCFGLLRRFIFDFFMNLRCFQGFQQYFLVFWRFFQGCVGVVARIFWISFVFWDFIWYFAGEVLWVLLGIYTVRGFPCVGAQSTQYPHNSYIPSQNAKSMVLCNGISCFCGC